MHVHQSSALRIDGQSKQIAQRETHTTRVISLYHNLSSFAYWAKLMRVFVAFITLTVCKWELWDCLLAWFLSKGVRDSSGFALTYVDSPRRYDAGTLAIGHRVTPTELIPPGQDNFDIYGFCEPSCTSEVSIHTPAISSIVLVCHKVQVHIRSQSI